METPARLAMTSVIAQDVARFRFRNKPIGRKTRRKHRPQTIPPRNTLLPYPHSVDHERAWGEIRGRRSSDPVTCVPRDACLPH